MAAEDQAQKINKTGLTSEEVSKNREKYGSNVLTPPPRDPWWMLLVEKFDDPIIRILMIAAIIAIGVGTINGEYLEGIGIIVAILLATVLAFLNEYKAGKEFDILNQVSDEAPVTVLRDGIYSKVARKDIVVGDVVIIESGEEIPADGRLLEDVALQIDESKLTGESLPVSKFCSTAESDDSSSENTYAPDSLLRSTMVANGHGIFSVTAVGDKTEIGKAARAAGEESNEVTPLNRQLDRLSKLIGIIGFSIAFFTFIALVMRGYFNSEFQLTSSQWTFSVLVFAGSMIMLARVWFPIIADAVELSGKRIKYPAFLRGQGIKAWLKPVIAGLGFFLFCAATGSVTGVLAQDPTLWLTTDALSEFLKYFMIAVTIIVVAVPEGLPMSVTLSLAYSMRRMTAANNLVRRMHACETIGAATVICSDKTGTLTQNKMAMHSIYFPALPDNKLSSDLNSDAEKLLAELISVNSSANLSLKENEISAIGNPTEGAILLWLHSQGINYQALRKNFKLEKEWTFSTERKMMGSYGYSAMGEEKVLYVKGAPELLADICSHVLTTRGIEKIDKFSDQIFDQLNQAQQKGMRTLAFAFKRQEEINKKAELEEVAKDMVWLGFVAIADPIRPDVPKALEVCRKAGVKVKVVTGDNSKTALEISRQIGLLHDTDNLEDFHITGAEFQKLSEGESRKVADKIRIMSRARPADKLKLVKTLQSLDEVVAVTGDGTNDAPALNYANVGLSMGKTGASVAREASDIVLLDDSFPSLVKGIMWGRSLYENIQRFVMFQLTINFVALSVALTGPFIGVKMPLTVIQMLWVNLIMDTFAALALATEPPHWKVMSRFPRNPGDFIVSRPMYKHIFGVGIIFYIFLIFLLKYYQNDGLVDTYELSKFFTIFVMLQVWNMFNARALGFKHSSLKGIWENRGFMVILPAIVLIQFLIVQFGGLMFRTTPLNLSDWLICIVATSVVLWVGEIYRFVKGMNATDHTEVADQSPF
ncbi:MAG: calcium-translocating P-type ATPase, PMCA-type [Candidatus Rifleibacteriota bacterium]